MDALSNARFGQVAEPPRSLLVRALVAAVMACLVAAALLLVARRLAGGLLEPLTVSSLAATGLLLAGTGILIRHHVRREVLASVDKSQRQRSFVAAGITTLATLTLAGSVSLPDTPQGGLLALWVPILAGECGWLIHFLPANRRSEVATGQQTPDAVPDEPAMPAAPAQPAFTPQILPKNISQHIQRATTVDQRDSCFGWVRAVFQSRQRTETIHLAFCPPFYATPTVDVRQLDGPELQIKTAQVLPYGARLELRLSRACEEPVSATIGFTAVEATTDTVS